MRRGNHNGFILLAGMALGAGAMTLLDPERGSARRAYIRGRLGHLFRSGRRGTRKTAKYYWNSAYGHTKEWRARMQEGDIPDEILEERVKAQIGHVLSHQSVQVHARDGHVMVEGPIRRGEKEKLVDRLKGTRGVRSFHLLVEEHGTEEELPSFYGAGRRRFV